MPNRALLSTGVPAPASAPERGVEAPATGASCGRCQLSDALGSCAACSASSATLGVLLRYKVKEPYVVLACADLGIALH